MEITLKLTSGKTVRLTADEMEEIKRLLQISTPYYPPIPAQPFYVKPYYIPSPINPTNPYDPYVVWCSSETSGSSLASN